MHNHSLFYMNVLISVWDKSDVKSIWTNCDVILYLPEMAQKTSFWENTKKKKMLQLFFIFKFHSNCYIWFLNRQIVILLGAYFLFLYTLIIMYENYYV